ncbi:hypothetical protein [Bacillus alkalicellulosilyticus]|uniref:hypothetical protein n=1 Tax=Alkalihalobacterium alkalicellulosilyticum TaxID=1912214 RepID=UPI0009989C24|nr:hypothetical protein [Bacillus alkalicellulosilyticus]
MKKLFFSFVIILVLYSTYYDLTTGTLPEAASKQEQKSDSENTTQPSSPGTSIPFQEVIVESGYTVLSIVEHLHDAPVQASISQIVYDFQELNDGIKPEEIQIGKTYNFPLYHQE